MATEGQLEKLQKTYDTEIKAMSKELQARVSQKSRNTMLKL